MDGGSPSPLDMGIPPLVGSAPYPSPIHLAAPHLTSPHIAWDLKRGMEILQPELQRQDSRSPISPPPPLRRAPDASRCRKVLPEAEGGPAEAIASPHPGNRSDGLASMSALATEWHDSGQVLICLAMDQSPHLKPE
ncbi:hypothetical protein LX36DRAFT_192786 [Colletotrichum falcatum]|nr:hypothetical protein LX36DRAFT_192786 [Colletotrichum falcatum]